MEYGSPIRHILQTADEETRRAALRELINKPLTETRDILFLAMADASWRVRKEAVDLFVASNPDENTIYQLLELLRNEENAGLRNSASEAVVRAAEASVPCLIKFADDSDPDVRKCIIDAMGSIGSHLFLPSLLKALSDSDENVAAAAAEHLGNVGDTSVVPELMRSIISSNSLIYRFSALAALGRLNSHVAVPDEILALADQDILRQSVFNCLGNVGDESVSNILLKGFTSKQKNSRKAAILSWFKLFSQSDDDVRRRLEDSLRYLDRDEVVPLIIESFDMDDPLISEAVTVLLGILGDKRSVKTLLSAFSSERLSHQALKSLKSLEPAGIDAMAALFTEVDGTSRSAICAVIGDVFYRDGKNIVGQGLHDTCAPVRKSAVQAASKLGLIEFLPEIVCLLGDSDIEVKNAVVNCLSVLSRTDRMKILEVAQRLSRSIKPEHRRDAAILAAELGEGEYLSRLIKDEDPTVRQAAVVSLGKLQLAVSGNMLQIALVDENPEVRIAAAESLGAIGGKEVLDSLLAALHDNDTWVQSAVLQSIERVDTLCLQQAIATVFQKADGFLLITCLGMLDKIGTPEAMVLVESALENSDKDVVALAQSILNTHSAKEVY